MVVVLVIDLFTSWKTKACYIFLRLLSYNTHLSSTYFFRSRTPTEHFTRLARQELFDFRAASRHYFWQAWIPGYQPKALILQIVLDHKHHNWNTLFLTLITFVH